MITVPTEPTVLAYIAGIVDGEGCITATTISSNSKHDPTRRCHVLSLAISNTNEALVNWLLESIPGTRVRVTEKTKGRKIGYVIKMSGQNATSLLVSLLPYLVAKREQAKLAIVFGSTIGHSRPVPDNVLDAREIIMGRLHRLNAHGKVSA